MYDGHLGPRAKGDGYYIGDCGFGLFSRGVIVPGRGAGFKLATIHPTNRRILPLQPIEQSMFLMVDERTKRITAALDGPEITRWKTAADSALAASLLSRNESEVLLVLGSGPVSSALTEAYLHIRPSIREVLLWNRTPSNLASARKNLEARKIQVRIVDDLDAAVGLADIITTATSTATPLIRGACVRPGTHVDLVGGYRADMQEADCEVFRGARIFEDDRKNAAASGDLQTPLRKQVIQLNQIEADLFELCQMPAFQRSPEDRTVYKNAGGAHLDLFVSQYVVGKLELLARAS